MDVQALKKRIDEGGAGRFLFTGEESYLVRHYLKLLREAILTDPFTEAFNYIAFDGARVDVARLREALLAPPMMSERKLVVWSYPDLASLKTQEKTALTELLSHSDDFSYTTLVFICTPELFDVGNLPKKPSELYKTYHELLDIVEFRTSTDTQLLAWLKKHFDAQGIGVDAEVLRAMIARCGHGMEVLHHEVDKLCAFALANQRASVTAADVTLVCAPTFESQTFALTDALRDCTRTAAFAALRTLRAERAEVLMVVGMMARTYAELMSVCALLEQGRDAAAIAADMKLPPFVVRRDVAAVKKQGERRLRAAMAELMRIDTRL